MGHVEEFNLRTKITLGAPQAPYYYYYYYYYLPSERCITMALA
jgi:hypothetical protein